MFIEKNCLNVSFMNWTLLMFWSWSRFFSVLGKKGTELGMIIDRSTVNSQ